MRYGKPSKKYIPFGTRQERGKTRNQPHWTPLSDGRLGMGLWEFEIKEESSKVLDALLGSHMKVNCLSLETHAGAN